MPDVKEFYNLDFNDLKEQFKEFISDQTEFQDYNFEGSALSQLLDIITFGIQYQQMYLNMATNELFLDTAQIDTNVFKLANTLNYIPKRKSAAYIWTGIQRNNDIINGEEWFGAGDIVQPDPPDDWNLATGVVNGVYTIEDESANPSIADTHTGAEAILQIEQDDAGAKLISQGLATTIGKNYTFTVRYKTNGTQSARIIIHSNIDQSVVAGKLLDTTVSSAVAGEWEQLTFNFTATNALTYFTLGAGSDDIGENVQFDECRLTRNLSITLNKYSKFVMGSLSLTNFEDIIINDNEIHIVRLYEGEVNQQTWVSTGETFQEYQLTYRDEIDNEELNVFVDAPDGFGGFVISTDPWINVNVETFEINDPGYYIQHFEELKIKFDDGQRFQIPLVNERVRIIYVKTQGAAVNGNAAIIIIDSSVTFFDELTVTRLGVLENGVDEESMDAIRVNAPLFYTTQNRAVTADDQNILVKKYSQFDTFFDAFLWGGELEFVEEVAVTPPTFPATFYKRLVEFWPTKEFPFIDVGHVYCTALKDDFDYLDQTEIDDLIDFLNITKIVAIFYRFLQPQIVHILPTVNIKHESVLNLDTVAIAEQIDTWLNDNLEGFNKTFHLSNLIQFVDSIDEVIETSITYTTHVTVKDIGYVAVRLWNEVIPGSVSGLVNGFLLTDDGVGGLWWNGNQVGTIIYAPPPTPLSANQTGGFLIINQDDTVSFGLPAGSTYDLNFEYTDNRTVELNRESFMLFDPIILNAEVYEETQ
jgi:hypothetical protein